MKKIITIGAKSETNNSYRDEKWNKNFTRIKNEKVPNYLIEIEKKTYRD